MIDADVLIEGGTIVDGTGAPGFAGSVVVVGDRLLVLQDAGAEGGDGDRRAAEVRARRRIEARGLVVAPGFIDLHSHGGLVMLAEPLNEPKVRQGVTSELIGVDGNATHRSRRAGISMTTSSSTAGSTAGRRSPTTGPRSPSTSRGTTGGRR